MTGQTDLTHSLKKPVVAIIIPSFNEGPRLLRTLRTLVSYIEEANHPTIRERDFNILVVDDGSHPLTDTKTLQESRGSQCQIFLLRHWVNLGQGAALQTGIEFAREKIHPDHFVTMDADGQHSPSDLPLLLETIIKTETDIVFGNRFIGISNTPALRRAVLAAAGWFEYWMTGLKLGDAHNGYRIFNSKLGDAINLKYNRMAHATEFKEFVGKYGFRFTEAKVSIHYSQESLAKGQSNIGAFRIIRDLIAGHIFD
jgi:glycosyltransferase involved in cell wall biosynthesis